MLLGCLILASGALGQRAVSLAAQLGPQQPERPVLIAQVGHQGGVFGVDFSPDGGSLVSAGLDDVVRLWDVRTGMEIRRFIGHTNEIHSVAFSSDGKVVASASMDRKVRIWDPVSGKHIGEISCDLFPTNLCFVPHSNELLVSTADGATRVWDITHPDHSIDELPGQSTEPKSLDVSRDGRLALLGCKSGEATLWRLSDHERMGSYSAPYVLNCCRFSPRGDLFCLCWDGLARVYRTASGELVSEIKLPSASAAFSSDGKRLFIGGMRGQILIVNPKDGQAVASLGVQRDRTDLVRSLTISKDGSLLAAGYDDRRVLVWSTVSYKQTGDFAPTCGPVASVVLSSPDHLLITAMADGTVRQWDLEGGKQSVFSQSGVTSCTFVARSGDGSELLVGYWNGFDGQVAGYLFGTSQRLFQVPTPHSGYPHAGAFSPDGREFCLAADSGDVVVCSSRDGHVLRKLPSLSKSVLCLAYSPDGSRIVAGGADHSAAVWDSITGAKLFTIQSNDGDDVRAVGFDGQSILTASANKVRRWSQNGVAEDLYYEGATDSILDSIALSPRSKRRIMAGSSLTGDLFIWDLDSGNKHRFPDPRLRALKGHEDMVNSVALSEDGAILVSAGNDGSVRLWDTVTGSQLCQLYSFFDGAWAVMDSEGRFDTGDISNFRGLHWVMPDEPFTPLPLEQFMQDYYAPGLLPRKLDHDVFSPVPDVSALNRAVPSVSIDPVTIQHGGTLQVTVHVKAAVADKLRPNQHSCPARTLKLFRDGQIVAFKLGEVQNGDELFDIALPHSTSVELTAYAFNSTPGLTAAVKGPTFRRTVAISAFPRQPRTAYVLAVGCANFHGEAPDLSCPLRDIDEVSRELRTRLARGPANDKGFDRVVSIPLPNPNASNVEEALHVLAGTGAATSPSLAALAKAKPDDLFILFWSGHGDERNGNFELIPSTGKRIDSRALADLISPIDCREISLILDTCRSGDSIPEGFKAGPFGDSGLGQLAFDKGLALLCASRGLAFESRNALGYGLLTYALVNEGLLEDKRQGILTMTDWFKYAVSSLPGLSRKVLAGGFSRSPGITSRGTDIAVEQPALFDFLRFDPPILSTKN